MKVRAPVGTLFVAAALWAAAGAGAGSQESKIVKIQTLNVRDILYILTGGGGNALAMMRDDGVVVIDTKQPGWGRPLLSAIEAVTDRPVSIVINTHAHADHTGGNLELPAGVQIIAHENAARRMRELDVFKGAVARSLPNQTVTDRLSLLEGADRIDLYYLGRGHTDGDLVVVFPEKRLAHFGDLFPAKAAPQIDASNGGSGVAFPETLARAVAEIKGVLRVTTGHDESSLVPKESGSAIYANPRTMSWADLQEYADFNRDFLAAVREARQAGKSAAEAAASLQLPARYKAYDLSRAKENVALIYRELQ